MRFLRDAFITLIVLVAVVWIVAYTRIRAGGMSADAEPGAVERTVAARLVRLSIPAEAQQQQNPFRADPAAWRAAADHYEDHCAICHGSDGHGRTGMGENMYPKVPDLADAGVQRLSDGARSAPQLRLGIVVLRETLEQDDGVALRRAVLETDDREPADGLVAVRGRERVQHRAHAVDRARVIAGQELERDQRRAARSGTPVVEPAPEELLLRAPAELSDRAERKRALAVVGAARGGLQLVAPLAPELRELTFRACDRELVRARRCFTERHAAESTYHRPPWAIALS